MTIGYKMLWKHKDFSEHSEGPVLRHTITKTPYTKRWADSVCLRFNEQGKTYKTKDPKGKLIKLPVVKHWVREAFI